MAYHPKVTLKMLHLQNYYDLKLMSSNYTLETNGRTVGVHTLNNNIIPPRQQGLLIYNCVCVRIVNTKIHVGFEKTYR